MLSLCYLGHALGFYHEQSRPDRDEYVTIYRQNIQRGIATKFPFKLISKLWLSGIVFVFNADFFLIFLSTKEFFLRPHYDLTKTLLKFKSLHTIFGLRITTCLCFFKKQSNPTSFPGSRLRPPLLSDQFSKIPKVFRSIFVTSSKRPISELTDWHFLLLLTSRKRTLDLIKKK